MDAVDRAIINRLQDGIPVVERPFAAVAAELGLDEDALIARLERALDDGVLSRFGPMFDAERMGGAFALCAMHVPANRFEVVAALVNAHPEVAHNYRREHHLNMWFVLGTETAAGIERTLATIAAETGLEVLAMPKEREYYVGLRLEA
jgi:DNA-binding Lrp family transcriptional regulator